jgi:protein-ribulosamine 3-kinase
LSVPPEIERSLAGLGIKAHGYSRAGGGCINECAIIRTHEGSLFIKWNAVDVFPGMLEAESAGLQILRQTSTLTIPEVVKVGSTENYQYLLLEFIESTTKKKNYWQEFGEGLARLHQNSASYYGLDHNNYIGSLPQHNTPLKFWPEFFARYRVEDQVRVATQKNLLSIPATRLSKFIDKLPSLLVEEKPALIHGDLWSGNLMTGNDGAPVLIDPAVYYGNRECDIAMTQLFGGFDERFIDFYNEVAPLVTGWRERLPLYNVYPILVHINLFGKSYEPQLISIVSRYT